MSFSFYFPTKLIFSEDAATDLVQELASAPKDGVLFLTDKGIIQAGIATKVLDKLKQASFQPIVFDDIPGNPNVPDVKKALSVIEGRQITHVVALGGGSVLDVAKAVGLLLGDPELDYEEVQWRRQPIKKAPLPVIGIPTTAGTGSEVTHVAVVGDSKGFKMGVLNPAMFMKCAIIDGNLMLSLPPQLTATTGMDALVHSIEAFLSKKANNISDLYALSAIRGIVKWLPEAYKNGANLEARQQMAMAATLAGISFDQSSLGLVHALAGPLCGTYHLHHGLGVAVLLPATLEFDAPAIPTERWDLLRDALALPADAKPEVLGDFARDLLKTLDMPTHLSEVGLEAEKIPAIAETATRMAMIGFNVRSAGLEDCQQVLEAGL
ncbi:MAG: iron-containing alcohol dehydrogenase [Anaerolineaceae bacterium]|nr:iron-containing alcohol dehydrogenase [Anaerolineaceae bacterium]